MSVHFMSQSVDWATPCGVTDALTKEGFEFDCDPCCLGGGMWLKSRGNLTHRDGLMFPWGRCSFVNPPYGREIGKWTAKAVAEWQLGKTVVMLIPSRTDTIWWHRDVMTADEIRFVKGRLKFGGSTNSAPFPSAIAVWRGLDAAKGDTAPQKCPADHRELVGKGDEIEGFSEWVEWVACPFCGVRLADAAKGER